MQGDVVCMRRLRCLPVSSLTFREFRPSPQTILRAALAGCLNTSRTQIQLCYVHIRVVNATSPALGSTAVREAKKLSRTILVLSQSKLVRSEQQIQERIFDRLLRQSRDCQHLEGLADCVAVASCHCKHQQLQSEHPLEDIFQKLDSGVCGCLIKHTLCGLKQSSFQLPSDFLLTEEDKVQSMRTHLDSQLLQLQLLLDKLMCVEDMFNPVACGGPWWEAAHQAAVDPADFGSASNGDSESPTHAAVWESVHRALHQQQLLQQQLEPFTATLVPVDPAGNNLSSSALLGSGPQAHNSLPPASLSSKSAPLSVLPAAACAQVEADLESVTLTSAPKPAWEGSEDSFSWVESEGSHIHQDAMQFPFAF